MMQFIWIRHGMTKGNMEKRYIGGRTDEPLCEQGRRDLHRRKAAGVYPEAELVCVSPMKRCMETAQILYPDVPKRIVPGFRECDFGLFENKTYRELTQLPVYQEWIDSNGSAPFPDGEEPAAFNRRSLLALQELAEQGVLTQRTAFVVHGGTIMAVCSGLDVNAKGYYDYHVDNGCGYLCEAQFASGKLWFRSCEQL